MAICAAANTLAKRWPRLAGAALDTFEPEPPARNSPLLRLPNVTVTSHIAGASVKIIDRAAVMIAAEVRRHVTGAPPVNSVPSSQPRRNSGVKPVA